MYPRSKREHAWIFIVVDHFLKFTVLKAMREASSADVVNFLVHEVLFKFGVPEVIHSDNGWKFISKSFEAMIKAFGIVHLCTPVYSPQSNAAESGDSGTSSLLFISENIIFTVHKTLSY